MFDIYFALKFVLLIYYNEKMYILILYDEKQKINENVILSHFDTTEQMKKLEKSFNKISTVYFGLSPVLLS